MSDSDEEFRIWMKEVDSLLSDRCGMTSADLPDQLYRDWFDDGMEPAEWLFWEHFE